MCQCAELSLAVLVNINIRNMSRSGSVADDQMYSAFLTHTTQGILSNIFTEIAHRQFKAELGHRAFLEIMYAF